MHTDFLPLLPVIAAIFSTATAIPPSYNPAKECEGLPTTTTLAAYGRAGSQATKWCAEGQPKPSEQPRLVDTPNPSGYNKRRLARRSDRSDAGRSQQQVASDQLGQLLSVSEAFKRMEDKGKPDSEHKGADKQKRSTPRSITLHDLPPQDGGMPRLPRQARNAVVDENGRPLHDIPDDGSAMQIMRRAAIMSADKVDPTWKERMQRNSNNGWRNSRGQDDGFSNGGTMSVMPVKREAIPPPEMLNEIDPDFGTSPGHNDYDNGGDDSNALPEEGTMSIMPVKRDAVPPPEKLSEMGLENKFHGGQRQDSRDDEFDQNSALTNLCRARARL